VLNFRGDMTVREYIEHSISGQLEIETGEGGGEPRRMDPEVKERLERFRWFLVSAYPAINISFIALLVLLHLIWLKELWSDVAERAGIRDLSVWRAREYLVWPFLAAGFSLLAPRDSVLFLVGLNLFIVATLPFLFQGMAIASFFMKKYGLPRFARALLYILIFSQPWFIILIFVGLADIWADLRKLKGARTA
ncbi:MAG TPA: DUF2232 domain-containing protein, partial [Proteobacteria bacterium]|nr:DUF2232 domain-containing protein [Pseudomonadota bacterium]